MKDARDEMTFRYRPSRFVAFSTSGWVPFHSVLRSFPAGLLEHAFKIVLHEPAKSRSSHTIIKCSSHPGRRSHNRRATSWSLILPLHLVFVATVLCICLCNIQALMVPQSGVVNTGKEKMYSRAGRIQETEEETLYNPTSSSSGSNHRTSTILASSSAEVDDIWQAALNDKNVYNNYRSSLLFSTEREWHDFVDSFGTASEQSSSSSSSSSEDDDDGKTDPFWRQIKMEAMEFLKDQPEAGPQLYQGIISQSSLLEAVCTCISHEIETELIPATEVKNLFLTLLRDDPDSIYAIRCDLQAVPMRSPSYDTAMEALLFSNGFHAMVCYRVGHLLWQAGRTGLAYYMQSTVSRKYSADIHPACRMGPGVYLRVGSGVVIGETATVGNDVSILEGVTLGGTGKEAGDRHPKVGNGVILQSSSAVLGNIPVGDGAVIMAKSIVTKPVEKLAKVTGVPARQVSMRELDYDTLVQDDLQQHLAIKYLPTWLEIAKDQQKQKDPIKE